MIKLAIRAASLAFALASIPAAAHDAPAPRAFVLNQWGGVVRCDFRANPYATAKMVAWCAGASIRSADPARFDCRRAEVSAEYDFCGLPYPTRR